MVFLSLLVSGVFSAAQGSLRNLGSNVLFVSSDARLQRGGSERLTLSDVRALELAPVAGVARISPMATLTGAARVCELELVVQIIGATSDALNANGWRVSRGRFLSALDGVRRMNVAVIGAGVLEQAKCDVEVGEEIELSGARLTVVGSLVPRGQGWLPGFDNIIVVPLSFVESYYGESASASALLTVTSERALREAAQGVRMRLSLLRGSSADDIMIQSQAEAARAVDTLQSVLQACVAAVAGLALVIAAIGVLNAVMTSVIERTPEIGLRRAVGATKRDICVQQVAEALAISGIGGLAGVGAGAACGWLILWMLETSLTPNPSMIVLALASSVVLGLVAGLWPAWRAASLDPVAAIRHE